MKVYMCLLMIVAIWIISISISLPLGIYHEVNLSNDSVYMCGEQWPKAEASQFFTVTSLVLHYIVPCVIISFCYIKVSAALRKRSKVKIGSGQRTREREEMEIRRNRRTNKMLIAMVVIFLLCWMPLNLTNLMRDAHESLEKWYYFTLVFFLAHVAAMSSTIYNPFLYAWMNDNFKKEFRHVLPCLFFSRGASQSPTSYTQYTNVDTNQASVVVNRSPVKNGGGGTNDCTVDIPPPNNSNAGAMIMKDVKAYYDTDSEKVCLNVLNNTKSANHHHHQPQPRDAIDKQQQLQPLTGRRAGPVDLDYAENGSQEQETAT
ncbi:hypothetical protein EGW08_004734 [Elysia chlorotica]|uniref:G-protein coupled receptors family 1 profile domain-containing protein n=1 Tax=Elysia chlorotica TaxID=188477 RepID=A0A3S1BG18_ELYCH|nr:hypothetical protein EGW08_004734 [Elysia chlorotica]